MVPIEYVCFDKVDCVLFGIIYIINILYINIPLQIVFLKEDLMVMAIFRLF